MHFAVRMGEKPFSADVSDVHVDSISFDVARRCNALTYFGSSSKAEKRSVSFH
jgi:hypothetical protein